MQHSKSENLANILSSKMIPLLRGAHEFPFVVARQEMRAVEQPYGVTLTRAPIKGPRVVQRDRRISNNQRLYVAEYPDANLQEIAPPKLCCIIDGEADYLLGNYSVHCKEGNVILIPPRMPHQASGPFLSRERLKTGACNLLHAHAFGNGINIWLSASRGARHGGDYADNYYIYDQTAADIFYVITTAAQDARPHWKTLCGGLLIAFFTLVLQEIEAGHFTRKGPPRQEEPAHSPEDNFAGQVRVYVEANCHRPLKLANVASHFFMSVSQFTRRLRLEGDATFVDMLMDARIEQAKKFLLETNLTFVTIAGHCGFNSDRYFRAQFIKHVGCTPSEYRRRPAKLTK
jgi:AraC-like DNA-binding protein